MQTITNDSFAQLCRLSINAYTQNEDYGFAVDMLREFIGICEKIPGYDRLILDYLRGIYDKYEMLLKRYEEEIDKEIDEKAMQIYQGNYLKTYQAAKNAASIFEKLKGIGRKSPALTKKKSVWFNLIKANKEQMEFTLYSGKK
jgi:hypothetical protein